LTLKVVLVAWKYSSLELDYIACFAGSGVGLDYPEVAGNRGRVLSTAVLEVR
jgi:hypothetical protein